LYCEQLQLRVGKISMRNPAEGQLTTQIPYRNMKSAPSAVIAALLLSTRQSRDRHQVAKGHTRVTAAGATAGDQHAQ
jgi:hypothetical protein